MREVLATAGVRDEDVVNNLGALRDIVRGSIPGKFVWPRPRNWRTCERLLQPFEARWRRVAGRKGLRARQDNERERNGVGGFHDDVAFLERGGEGPYLDLAGRAVRGTRNPLGAYVGGPLIFCVCGTGHDSGDAGFYPAFQNEASA